ncbi:MAG: hypothetical protein CO031_01260 [Candidatus Nealsonbacteria bacterium CG_4_9_14_0_2_um_filter_37_38]|uniref:Serine protease n=1 Tax=Candidatus Nealsonbacteria bacterium CG_4_10_14_0_8_um_filter_37_14 TaxID=1974684 RepID=A0A2M7R783_9BACT|nr:MAG: hypothetical protein COV63_01175 [Candidatus Nealsonbacteria bacterium CG11_big_fil_rev_8_21_14_0_20_37_68]PIW92378.1 MAG: hypothetical protein COZ89_00135 [Candidatus Nealsonbacteria bacterium CG_4_8_14_3_um_filter_37_23]PIY89276.1 MAG: hypothetical protein COY73_01485 [Candidatus Nealsonbacteria bacterium CG_4_10_14_0_8_um_filter_37_14]PJC51664.1 MAG: hypothetical protein CO031_01260 [Candidatus Nealsonbacteria bacterium CG_4_9_14_0_2_um_filter_37_38]
MLKNVFKILAVFIVGMVGGIFADQILWPYFIERPLFYEYRLEQTPVNVIEKKEIFIQENVALQEAVKKVEKAVVWVRTETKTGKILEGSGLVMTSDGLIVTLADLVPAGSDFTFLIEGKPMSYQILARDFQNNLALIKVEGANLSTASFGSLDKINTGERVFLVGTISQQKPGGEKEIIKIVNEGVIKYFDQNLIHTNIFEKYTLAGSPLFNIEGNVLGLNEVDKEGKIIAIPISIIREFIKL